MQDSGHQDPELKTTALKQVSHWATNCWRLLGDSKLQENIQIFSWGLAGFLMFTMKALVSCVRPISENCGLFLHSLNNIKNRHLKTKHAAPKSTSKIQH